MSVGQQKKKEYQAILVFVGIAFSSQCGGGFASGGTPITYFLTQGYPGIFMPFLVAGINAFVLYFAMKFAMDFKLYDYNSFLTKYTGKHNRFFRWVYEFNYNWLLIVVMALAYSTSGGVIADLTGIPYTVTTFIIALIMYFIVAKGEGVVRKNAVIMSVIILIALVAIHVPNLLFNVDKIAKNATLLQAKDTSLSAWGIACLWGYIFAGQNLAGFGAYINHANIFESKETIKKAVLLSVLLNFLILMIVNLNLLANYDVYSMAEPKPNIPVLLVIQNGFGMPVLLSLLLSIAIFFATISTAINYIQGFNTRVLTFIAKKKQETEEESMKNKHSRTVKITIIYIVVTWVVSQVGLTALISKGLTVTSILTLVSFVIPTVINAIKGW